jgi:hypothetical protein
MTEPKTTPQYAVCDLMRLLAQAETLQHQRVYFFLVAETIFFLAAGTVLAAPIIVIILSLSGITVSILFTIVNLRNYWRTRWLINHLKQRDTLFNDSIQFKDFDINLGRLGNWARKCLIYPDPPKPKWHSTGNVFTWGLLIVTTLPWLGLFIYALWKLVRC